MVGKAGEAVGLGALRSAGGSPISVALPNLRAVVHKNPSRVPI